MMVVKQTQRRILRDYRNSNPRKFHSFNQGVVKALTDNPKIPESTWGANPALLALYLSTAEKHDAMFHQALYGSRLDIAQRDILQAQLVDYLDEMASLLEAVAVRNQEVLIYSGFNLAKERRSQPRTKAATPSEVTETEQPATA